MHEHPARDPPADRRGFVPLKIGSRRGSQDRENRPEAVRLGGGLGIARRLRGRLDVRMAGDPRELGGDLSRRQDEVDRSGGRRAVGMPAC
jgi:hypothetical protein